MSVSVWLSGVSVWELAPVIVDDPHDRIEEPSPELGLGSISTRELTDEELQALAELEARRVPFGFTIEDAIA